MGAVDELIPGGEDFGVLVGDGEVLGSVGLEARLWELVLLEESVDELGALSNTGREGSERREVLSHFELV